MKITIKKDKRGLFNVYALGKIADSLGYDEMLGLISSLTMPEHKPCMNYLKTKAQIKAYNELFEREKPKETKQPLLLDRNQASQTSFSTIRHQILQTGGSPLMACPKHRILLEWNINLQQFSCRYCDCKTGFPLGFIIELRRKHNLPMEPELKAGFTRVVETEERIKQLAKLKAPLLVTEWLDGKTLVSSLFVACLNPATLSRLLRNKLIFEFNSL